MTASSAESDSTVHQSLADYIKGVHAHLRQRVQEGVDVDRVWMDHLHQEKDMRRRYASSMRQLATNHWDHSPVTDDGTRSRIEWIRRNVLGYFYGEDFSSESFDEDASDDEHRVSSTSSVVSPCNVAAENSALFSALCKDVRRDLFHSGLLQKHPDSNRPSLSTSEAARVAAAGRRRWRRCVFGDEADKTTETLVARRLCLLDVGSCYDPFSRFRVFKSVAIDISPSTEGVVEMDFIEAGLVNSGSDVVELNTDAEKRVESIFGGVSPSAKLHKNSFHVVVFSLLLEYFPSSRQRWICCLKANRVLRTDGALVIVTPDSSHVNKRAPQMKSWQKALETHLGFRRCKYEKLIHLHCMMFRKVKEIDDSVAIDDFSEFFPLLYIPQDHNRSGTTPVSVEAS